MGGVDHAGTAAANEKVLGVVGHTDDFERHDLADIKDLIVMSMHLSATGSTEGSRMVVRPGTLEDTERARMRARQARERIEQTEWRDVTDG